MIDAAGGDPGNLTLREKLTPTAARTPWPWAVQLLEQSGSPAVRISLHDQISVTGSGLELLCDGVAHPGEVKLIVFR